MVQVQGGRVLMNEAYEQYAAVTKGEAQRRRWAFFSCLHKKSPRAGGGARAVGNYAWTGVSFATATRRENAAWSTIARSASTLRLISTPAFFKPAMRRL